ncbi:permease-like cell division protein FtsX [Nonomuraea sp. NEAU-A123]|uniref:permease-like cell division protein FtsX n=1 Tax=Nonomuraea sp. NEAU-A123 TaxID=2839649 RepID=UPI001BE4B204|nr:permease-like cell division protein FtsX [Nonomuraea sp. NEAU-A123]MBT2226033.1 permease-like cell division protein FtsX [Nonomuraea sp. NEAU-A123]
MKRWLWRLTVAAVVALSGMTGPVVSAEAASAPEVNVGEDREIAVFLCTPSADGCHKRYATAKQRRDVGTLLKATPEVTEVRFVSRAAAYASFRQEFAGQKKVLASVRAKDMPESFRVRVSGEADRTRIVLSANGRPGVGLAVDQAKNGVHAPLKPEISVFLCMKGSDWPACLHGRGKANKSAATAKEKKAIVAVIERIPGLESYVYEDQRAAYRNFVKAYADNEALVSATRVSDMPESYRLSMRPKADLASPIRRLERMPGVGQAYDQRCLFRKARLLSEYGLEKLLPVSEGCG